MVPVREYHERCLVILIFKKEGCSVNNFKVLVYLLIGTFFVANAASRMDVAKKEEKQQREEYWAWVEKRQKERENWQKLDREYAEQIGLATPEEAIAIRQKRMKESNEFWEKWRKEDVQRMNKDLKAALDSRYLSRVASLFDSYQLREPGLDFFKETVDIKATDASGRSLFFHFGTPTRVFGAA